MNESNKTRFTKFLIQFGGNPFFEQIHPFMIIEYADAPKISSRSKSLIKRIEKNLRDLDSQYRMFSFDELKGWLVNNKLLSIDDLRFFINNIMPNGTGAAYFYKNFRSTVVHTGWYSSVHFGNITCDGKEVGKINHTTCINALRNIFKEMSEISRKSGKFLKEI